MSEPVPGPWLDMSHYPDLDPDAVLGAGDAQLLGAALAVDDDALPDEVWQQMLVAVVADGASFEDVHTPEDDPTGASDPLRDDHPAWSDLPPWDHGPADDIGQGADLDAHHGADHHGGDHHSGWDGGQG